MSADQTAVYHASPSATQTINLNDCPKMPPLRLVLKTPTDTSEDHAKKYTFFSSLKNTFENSKYFNLFAKEDKKKILRQVEKNGCLTKTDIDKINQHMSAQLQKALDHLKKEILDALLITAKDAPEIIMFKTVLGENIAEYLENFSSWFYTKLKEVLKIKDMKERKRLTNELFEKLSSMMKKNWGDSLEEQSDPAACGDSPELDESNRQANSETVGNENYIGAEHESSSSPVISGEAGESGDQLSSSTRDNYKN